MRIISQNKWNDLTYDGSNISIRQDKQFEKYDTLEFQIVSYDLRGQFLTIGEYSSEERALNVMKEIRSSYLCDSQKILVPNIDDATYRPIQHIPINHFFYMPKDTEDTK